MADTKTSIIISAVDQTQAAFDSAKRSLSSLETGINAVRTAMGALGFSIAGIGLMSIVKNSLEAADQMGKTAQKIGTTTEALSALKYAADLNDVSFESLQTGMGKLAKSAFDAATGGKESAQIYAALGIKVKDAGGNVKDSTKLLMELADRFAAMPDGVEKTALAMKVFGKSGADMIPLLNGGARAIQDLMKEAKQIGVVVGDDLAQKANIFNDNLKRLGSSSTALGYSIAIALLPNLNDTAAAMVKASNEGNKLWMVLLGLGGIGKIPLDLYFGDTKTVDVSSKKMIFDLKAEIGQLERNKESGGGSVLGRWLFGTNDEIDKKIAILKNQLAAFEKFGSKLDQKPATPASTATDDGKLMLRRVTCVAGGGTWDEKTNSCIMPSKVKSDYESFSKRLQIDLAPQDADGKQTRAAKLQIELDLDKTITTKEREKLQLLIEQVGVQDAAIAAKKSEREGQQILIGLEKDFHNELEKRRDALNAPLLSASEKALADDMRTVTKRAQDARIELEKLHVAGSLSAADYDRRLQQVTADEIAQKDAVRVLTAEQNKLNASWQYGADIALRSYLDELQNVAKSSEAMFTRAFHGMEDSLVQFVRTGKLDFKSLADNIINNLIRIQIQQSIMKPMAAAMDSAGGLGKLLGSFLGGSQTGMAGFSADQLAGPVMSPAAKGAWFDGGVSAFANGGIVDSPTMFRFGSGGAFRTGLMGEAGPEAVMPLSRGSDGKLGVRTQGGSSNVPPNVVVQVINQSGQAVTAKQQGGPQFDGRDWVLGVVLEAADSNPHFRNAMGMAR